ncbi:MAG TPA: hypothetical protein VJ672_08800 [Gemmatimonadaceae bacterium]|nr:hypothetical protein [Gemmatimonadaceae bacterium]
MADVLVQFSEPVVDEQGIAYTAQACGRLAENDLWEGWLEFIPLGSLGEPLRTSRETTQPNRTDLAYWASGLTMIFLEGALARAKDPTRMVRRNTVDAAPRFEGPAPHFPEPAPPVARAVLNPHAVYAQGEDVLRQELTALDGSHLRNILRAYWPDIPSESFVTEVALRERIVALAREAFISALRESGSTSQLEERRFDLP